MDARYLLLLIVALLAFFACAVTAWNPPFYGEVAKPYYKQANRIICSGNNARGNPACN